MPMTGIRHFRAAAAAVKHAGLSGVKDASNFVARRGRGDGSFPLTPAISPRERESRIPSFDDGTYSLHADERTAFLPPPKGEGWGEGEEKLPGPTVHRTTPVRSPATARVSINQPLLAVA
jgi:hypothetical protein